MKTFIKIINYFFISIIIFFTILIIYIIANINKNNTNKNISIFNYQAYIVLSNSMEGEFVAGDFIVSKKINPHKLKEGNIISFISNNNDSKGMIITHKIKEIDFENKLITTYGIKTGTIDQEKVSFDNVLGKYYFKINKLGFFIQFIKSKEGIIIIILIYLLFYFLFKFIKNIYKYFKIINRFKSDGYKN